MGIIYTLNQIGLCLNVQDNCYHSVFVASNSTDIVARFGWVSGGMWYKTRRSKYKCWIERLSPHEMQYYLNCEASSSSNPKTFPS